MFFWNSLAFSMIQQMLAIWSLVSLPFLKPTFTSGSSRFTSVQILLKPGLENFRHHFTSICFFDDQMYVGNLISGSSGSQDRTTPKCCHKGRNKNRRTSLLVQWWGIHLPMQVTWVWPLVQKDPTCCRATKSMWSNYWACALEPMGHN